MTDTRTILELKDGFPLKTSEERVRMVMPIGQQLDRLLRPLVRNSRRRQLRRRGLRPMDSVHCRMQPLTWPYFSKCGAMPVPTNDRSNDRLLNCKRPCIVKSLKNKPANKLRRTLSLGLCALAVAPRLCGLM